MASKLQRRITISVRLVCGIAASLFLPVFLLACSHTPAPVEERSVGSAVEVQGSRPPDRTTAVTTRPARLPGVTESEAAAGNDGWHVVTAGETLYGIAFHHGLDYRDLAGWNDIAAPYRIYTRQRLRLTAPEGYQGPAAATGSTPASPSATKRVAETQPRAPATDDSPAPPREDSSASEDDDGPEQSAGSGPPATEPSRRIPAVSVEVLNRDPEKWLWPARGSITQRFNPAAGERKGIIIAAQPGDPVLATAAGQVVYSGNGLIGYGELVIIKHSARLLSAYAHNSRRLVLEGDLVAAGQAIAEVGQDGRGRPGLHFEVRRNGQPVDPLGYLPRL